MEKEGLTSERVGVDLSEVEVNDEDAKLAILYLAIAEALSQWGFEETGRTRIKDFSGKVFVHQLGVEACVRQNGDELSVHIGIPVGGSSTKGFKKVTFFGNRSVLISKRSYVFEEVDKWHEKSNELCAYVGEALAVARRRSDRHVVRYVDEGATESELEYIKGSVHRQIAVFATIGAVGGGLVALNYDLDEAALYCRDYAVSDVVRGVIGQLNSLAKQGGLEGVLGRLGYDVVMVIGSAVAMGVFRVGVEGISVVRNRLGIKDDL